MAKKIHKHAENWRNNKILEIMEKHSPSEMEVYFVKRLTEMFN